MCKAHSIRRLIRVTEVTVSGDALTHTISRTYMLSAVLKFNCICPRFEVSCAESR